MTASVASRDSGSIFRFDEFELDMSAFELRRSGKPVPLEPQVIEVLAVLVENEGRVVTKDELLDRVWPERYVTEAALNSRVMSARKALGDNGQEQRYIKTVHGRGYRFAGGSKLEPPVESPMPDSPAEAERPSYGFFQSATSFVGRGEELSRLVGLLTQPSARLITVAGIGGIGKTRLLAHACRIVAERGTETEVIGLENVSAGGLGSALAAGLRVRSGTGTVSEQIIRHLGERRVLLVLDNVEQLADEARILFPQLLDEAPGVRIACSSRETLSLRPEWVVRLGGLSPADAVELFVERASRAGTESVASERAHVEQICEQVGYMPLAVELAAALTAYLDLRSIVELIKRDPESLATPFHDVPERHRSIYGLFKESCERLSLEDRDAIFAFTVFDGPFEATAAMAVAGADIGSLRRLVNSSLLQARDGRFAVHPMLRQFATMTPRGDDAEFRRRHAEHYLGLVASHTLALEGRGQLEAVGALDLDFGNVAAAWRWALSTREIELIELSRRGLFAYLRFRGRFTDADQMAAAAIEVADSLGAEATLSGLLVTHVWILMRTGDIGQAVSSLSRSLELARRNSLPWAPGYGGDGRVAAAMVAVGAGDYPGALRRAVRARDLAIEAGDQAGAAFASWIAGMASLRQTRLVPVDQGGTRLYVPDDSDSFLAEAARHIAEATQYVNDRGELWFCAAVAIESALQLQYAGDSAGAVEHLLRAYELRRKIGDPQGMANALFYLSDFAVDRGDATGAMTLLEEAEGYYQRAGDATGMAEVTRVRGRAYLALGDCPAALASLLDSLRRSLSLGFANNMGGVLKTIAAVYIAEGREDDARPLLESIVSDASSNPGSKATARDSLEVMGVDVDSLPAGLPTTREAAIALLARTAAH